LSKYFGKTLVTYKRYKNVKHIFEKNHDRVFLTSDSAGLNLVENNHLFLWLNMIVVVTFDFFVSKIF